MPFVHDPCEALESLGTLCEALGSLGRLWKALGGFSDALEGWQPALFQWMLWKVLDASAIFGRYGKLWRALM